MITVPQHSSNLKPPPDKEFVAIADYIFKELPEERHELAYETARYCLMDALGCAILALQYPACKKLLGPLIPSTTVPTGASVPGTAYYLDPVRAAFNIGTMIRWLDFNDTWLAREWGHPSDNLGAILALSDYMSRKKLGEGKQPYLIHDLLSAMIKAHEIQGIIALNNSFNRLGFDHVILVKLASTAIATYLLGGNHDQVVAALSQAFIDGACLRTYRHAPNTGTRKSWAAGDACSRAVELAFRTLQGEMGYPSALSVKTWGFNDVILKGKQLDLSQPFESYVMENVLFKISYPAEFHAQTAVECAIKLHQEIITKLDQIDKIILWTQESAIRIISKQGPLHNPADRDHCLQYMVAVALLDGKLTADDYENERSKDPRIDHLRSFMQVQEDPQFTTDYLDPAKRSIGNSIQVFFKDGTKTDKVTVEYPIGHRNRRKEGIPLLFKKFESNMATHYPAKFVQEITELFRDQNKLEKLPVNSLMDMLRC